MSSLPILGDDYRDVFWMVHIHCWFSWFLGLPTSCDVLTPRAVPISGLDVSMRSLNSRGSDFPSAWPPPQGRGVTFAPRHRSLCCAAGATAPHCKSRRSPNAWATLARRRPSSGAEYSRRFASRTQRRQRVVRPTVVDSCWASKRSSNRTVQLGWSVVFVLYFFPN